MKKISFLVLVLFVAVILSACATPYPMGIIYTEVKAPVGAGEGGMTYSKVGAAKCTSVLGLVATGDCSIKAAANEGSIKTIKYVDYDAKNILGIFGEYTTTVYGD
ncbi:MAG: TRL-like family protein [Candidatus Omnitrophica bacterium]|nr:TRL-like family protein [Candidatus Omnitrophota bacterium]